MASLVIWTVGHSTHPVDELVELLRAERIDVLADVRSQPYSRHNPQFRREDLSERFQAGLERLMTRAASYRVAIMCSEEDPARCHRRPLITPALVRLGADVRHIRGNGQVVIEADLAGGAEQDALFGP